MTEEMLKMTRWVMDEVGAEEYRGRFTLSIEQVANAILLVTKIGIQEGERRRMLPYSQRPQGDIAEQPK